MYGMHPKFQMRDAGASCLVVGVAGGLSWEDREVLANEVERYMQPRTGLCDVVVDMAAVEFVNSAGLGALFQLYRRVRERRGRLLFANVPALVGRVFNAVGLDRLAGVAPDLRSALAQVGATEDGGSGATGPAAPTVSRTGSAPEDEVAFTGT